MLLDDAAGSWSAPTLHLRRTACALLLLVCSLTAFAATAPAAHAGGTCGRFDVLKTGSPNYKVQNNTALGGTSCISTNDQSTAFYINRTAFDTSLTDPLYGPFVGYPSVYTGCKHGACIGQGFPVKAGAVNHLRSSWWFKFNSSGKYNATYDMFFNKTSTPRSVPDGAEIMVWMNHHNVTLGGPQLPDVTLDGVRYHLFVLKKPQGWNRIAYMRATPINGAANLDLATFVKDSMARGLVDKSWYWQQIEAGFEIWNGGAGLYSSGFWAGRPQVY